MKRFITAALAAASVGLPGFATVQPGTLPLIETVEETLDVSINPPSCEPGVAGSYKLSTRTLVLCPGMDIDADDHDTVRHEVWHAIQHCLTTDMSQGLQPVITKDTDDWWELVGDNLTIKQTAWIHKMYPESHWNVEYEAYAMASSLTSSQIQDLFIRACVD